MNTVSRYLEVTKYIHNIRYVTTNVSVVEKVLNRKYASVARD